MQKHGLKKAAVQRALDSLVTKGVVFEKINGKSKVYMASQKGAEDISAEEMAAREQKINAMKDEVIAMQPAVAALEAELRDLTAGKSMEDIKKDVEALGKEKIQLEQKLASYKGAVMIDPAEREKALKACVLMLAEWKKRKRIFTDIFSPMEENCDDPKKLLKQIGVESDDLAGVSFNDFKGLLENATKTGKRKR